MPIIKVKDPTGKIHKVDAPEGATHEQAIRFVQSQQTAPTPEEAELSLGDVAKGAYKNFYKSGKNMAGDIAQAVMHPVETATSMYGLAKGVIQLAVPGEQGNEEQARAVGKFFSNRYGSIKNIKKTIATDPVGFMSDLSVFLTGGGTAVAKGAQLGGKMSKAIVPSKLAGASGKTGVMSKVGAAGKAVADFGTKIDPVVLAGKGIAGTAKGVGSGVAALEGTLTSVGQAPVETAFKAGLQKGGSKSFKRGIKNTSDADVLVGKAVDALGDLKTERMAEYQADLAKLQKTNPRVDYKPIIQAMKTQAESLYDLATGKHHVVKNAAEKAKLKQIAHEIMTVVTDPDMHNALGFDHLKRVLNDSIDIDPIKMKHANRVRTALANKVKQQIIKSVPEYESMVGKYAEAMEMEKQLRSTFSIPERNMKLDTALKKLQFALRDGVNTGSGQRKKLLAAFDKTGEIAEEIAGQAFHSLTPQGIQRYTGPMGAAYLGTAVDPTLGLGILAAETPRLVGHTAYGLGRAASLPHQAMKAVGPAGMRGIGQGLLQSGRVADEEKKRNKKKKK